MLSPQRTLLVWYKVIQAFGGAIGISSLFLNYRVARRKVQHGSRKLLVDESGVHWSDVLSVE
jgi:hypothetical protein